MVCPYQHMALGGSPSMCVCVEREEADEALGGCKGGLGIFRGSKAGA